MEDPFEEEACIFTCESRNELAYLQVARLAGVDIRWGESDETGKGRITEVEEEKHDDETHNVDGQQDEERSCSIASEQGSEVSRSSIPDAKIGLVCNTEYRLRHFLASMALAFSVGLLWSHTP